MKNAILWLSWVLIVAMIGVLLMVFSGCATANKTATPPSTRIELLNISVAESAYCTAGLQGRPAEIGSWLVAHTWGWLVARFATTPLAAKELPAIAPVAGDKPMEAQSNAK